MTELNYTHDEWEKAREWAERVGRTLVPSECARAAITVLKSLPEPESDTRTLADMTDAERRNYIGGAVELDDRRGWHIGSRVPSLAFVLCYDERGTLIVSEEPERITPLPDEPRLVIPGVTRPHVQQEPPEEMLWWWATYEGGRVLIINEETDEENEVVVLLGDGSGYEYVSVSALTDWSRERDIEGADHA